MCFNRAFLALILSLLTLPAQSQAAEPETKIEEFHILPGLCIVESQQSCVRQFLFRWQLSQSDDACLYRELAEKPIYCANQQKLTTTTLTLDVRDSEIFTLKVADKKAVKNIRVRELSKEVRQGRRHLWSVF